ncbi:MAG TPA: hypothetical protein P5137_12880 [Candidatus Brocadiia bacterium]|nr:hypothetical protein [Candidatus Brocadiia bacterium]
MAKTAKERKPDVRELTARSGDEENLPAAVMEWEVRDRMANLARMAEDPQIGLGLELVKAPLYGAAWTVECESDEIAEFLTAEMKRLWRGALRTCLAAVEFGFSPHEKLWEIGEDGRARVKQLKDLDPKRTVILRDESGQFAGVRHGDAVVPAEKCLIFSHWKRWGNLYGTPRTRRVQQYWLWGKNVYELMNRYLHRRAIPPIVGYGPNEMRQGDNGVEENALKTMMQALRALKSAGIVTLPAEYGDDGKPLWSVSLLADTEQRAADFLKAIEHYETMKLRGMLVPDRVATQGATGAYSVAEAHTETFLMLEDQLLFDLLDTFNTYLLPQMVLFNFGPGAPPARMTSDGLNRETRTVMRELVEKLLANSLTGELVHDAVDVIQVLKGAGAPVVDDEEREQRAAERKEGAERQRSGVGNGGGRDARAPAWDPSTGSGRAALELAAGAKDERVAVAEAGAAEAAEWFEGLLGRVRKN